MSRTSASDPASEICLFISFVCNAILIATTVFSKLFRNFHLFAFGVGVFCLKPIEGLAPFAFKGKGSNYIPAFLTCFPKEMGIMQLGFLYLEHFLKYWLI